jgi:hypothetical protein
MWVRGFLVAAIAALAGSCTRETAPPASPASESGREQARQAGADSLDRAFNVFEEDVSGDVLQHFTALSPNENLKILDEALERVFPKGVKSPGESDVLGVLSYVAQTIKLKSSARHLGSEVLSDGQAYCYGFARAFQALCRRMGLPARINAVHNVEYMQAHNMAEVFYGGRWHLFDPTYGSFFYDRKEYDRSGRIPSAREMFSGSVSGKNVFMVCDALWTGEYKRDWTVQPLADDFRYRGMFTQRQFYDRLFATAFPLVQSELAASSFPITIDMGDRNRVSIGEVNGQQEDLEGRRQDSTYPRYQGTGFLGQGIMGPAFHTVTFKAATPGRFKMTYHFLPQSRFDGMGTVELRDVIMERDELAKDAWSVWFRLQTTEGLFLVVNRRDAAFLDAVTVERVE